MGQHTSKAQNDDILNASLPVASKKAQVHQKNQSFSEENPCMIAFFAQSKSSKSQKAPEWKSSTVQRLKDLNAKNWPTLLLRLLKEGNTKNIDAVYISEMTSSIERIAATQYFTSSIFASVCQNQESFIGENPVMNLIQNRESVATASFPCVSNEHERSASETSIQGDSFVDSYDLDQPQARASNQIVEKGVSQKTKLDVDLSSLSDLQNIPSQTSTEPFEKVVEGKSIGNLDVTNENINRIKRSSLIYGNKGFQHYCEVTDRSLPIDEEEQARRSLTLFKVIKKVLEQHLSNEKHILCQLMSKFTEYITGQYKQTIGTSAINDIPTDVIEDLCSRMTTDINQFIKMLCDTVYEYYNFEKLTSQGDIQCRELEKKDNINSFLVSMIFNDKVYKVIFDLYKARNNLIEKYCFKGLYMLTGLEPQTLGLPVELSLNQATINAFGAHRARRISTADSNNSFEVESHSFDKFKDGRGMLYEDSEEQSIRSSMKFKPYQKVITELLSLQQKQDPIEKLETLVNAADLIVTSIAEFYSNSGLMYAERLEYQHILTIFLYTIINSGLAEISAHLRMVENFVPKSMLGVSTGWISMIKISINQLCTLCCNNDGSQTSSSSSTLQK